MLESRISAGAREKLPARASGKPDAETISSWSYEMEGHAKKCVYRDCEMTINLKKRKMSQFALKLFGNVCIWLVLGDLTFCCL